MPNFKKEDLKYSYNWDTPFVEKKYVERDDLIDRNNGHQMLSFFNRFLTLHGLFSRSSLHRLEKLVCRHMPERINTRAQIKDWIGENWNKHF